MGWVKICIVQDLGMGENGLLQQIDRGFEAFLSPFETSSRLGSIFVVEWEIVCLRLAHSVTNVGRLSLTTHTDGQQKFVVIMHNLLKIFANRLRMTHTYS